MMRKKIWSRKSRRKGITWRGNVETERDKVENEKYDKQRKDRRKKSKRRIDKEKEEKGHGKKEY
jgi:hypothetical protein